MIRKCTHHKGNFEMIGRRRSKQSSGTMFSLPKNVDNHQYYRQTMNTTLLPYVKSMINVLQAEAIFSNYSSGESLMTLYKNFLDIRNPTELCEQTIITQNGFHNTVHTDIGSCLNTRDTNKVLNKLHHIKNIPSAASSYIKRVCLHTNGKLPKSTTCCWSLRSEDMNFKLVQYFVLFDYDIAYDLSSNFNSDSMNIGATFMSSLFNHCTSIPIWIDKSGHIHLVGPKNMYNFAWGSDGGSCNR